MYRGLLGEGYDEALDYIGNMVDIEVLEFDSGTKFDTWEVPEEWVIRDAWVKYNGEKIIDFKEQPLSVVHGSLPVNKTVNLEELSEHLHFHQERKDDYYYQYKFYEKDWGFTMPFNQIYKEVEETGAIEPRLEEGEYEVFVDSEYKPGKMKVGVHTIPGKTDREVLLFAHLDHPYQANDNLSGVAALLGMVKKLKKAKFDHTIKLVFCPETIGSIAYGNTADISKVDFVIALDCVGNKNEEGILFQKSFDREERVNDAAYLALRGSGTGFRQGIFRSSIGSDEYYFNDPKVNIPGIMFSTHDYPEYHTSADTPEIIDYDTIKLVQRVVLKTIEYYEKDFIPTREFKGPLHRSGYGLQTQGKQLNLSWDYLTYSMDGERRFTNLCLDFGLNFEHTLEGIERLVEAGAVSRSPIVSEGTLDEATR